MSTRRRPWYSVAAGRGQVPADAAFAATPDDMLIPAALACEDEAAFLRRHRPIR